MRFLGFRRRVPEDGGSEPSPREATGLSRAVRVLFTFVGGRGHFEPLVPVARAVYEAGHAVAFGCAPAMVPSLEAAGFTVFAMGPAGSTTPKRTPLRPLDPAREDRDLRERFVRRAARQRVPLTLELCGTWRPDVVVCDETDFGALVAAERLGLPYATVLVIGAGSFVRAEVVGGALESLRAEHGLPPDPDLEMLRRHLVLSPFPPSYRDPRVPLPATAHCFRTTMPDRSALPAPEWASVLPGAPSVYFTLGTVFNLESGDLQSRVVAGLRELRVHLIVTVGPQIEPAELGPQPAHVHVAQYLPQASVLPYCDLVVSHAGSGSVLGSLACGLPSVLIPLGADQPQNARRCAELGVARVLDPMEVTPESVRAAVTGVLEDPSYRRNAEGLRREIAGLPQLTHAVSRLERLAAAGR